MRFAHSFKEHIHRYAFAMPYAYKRDVLDAASKDGFGAQILSWVANSVTLADVSHLWLGKAKNNSYACRASFIHSDFNVGFPEGSWDTIVSFETIEHVDNPEFLIENFAKALRKNGVLVFSVPHMVANHEHKTLFDEEKIRAMIGKHFDIEEFHVQDKEYLKDTPMYKGLKCYVGVARKK